MLTWIFRILSDYRIFKIVGWFGLLRGVWNRSNNSLPPPSRVPAPPLLSPLIAPPLTYIIDPDHIRVKSYIVHCFMTNLETTQFARILHHGLLYILLPSPSPTFSVLYLHPEQTGFANWKENFDHRLRLWVRLLPGFVVLGAGYGGAGNLPGGGRWGLE